MNPYGPFSAEEFKALVDAPYGRALDAIRKHDPFYGRISAEGVPIKWRVKVTKEIHATGYVTVEAVTKEDAEALAEDADDRKVDWDYDDHGSFWVEEAKPA